MNIKEQTPDPTEDENPLVFSAERASQSGFTYLFDWFISRQDTDDLEGLMIACHSHVIELIDELNEDECPVDEDTQFFRDHAREIGFDNLMDLSLHGSCRDCIDRTEGDLFAAESYINELIEEVTKTEKDTNTRRHRQ